MEKLGYEILWQTANILRGKLIGQIARYFIPQCQHPKTTKVSLSVCGCAK